MRFTSFVPGSLVIILAALPAQAEPKLNTIPVSQPGIELSADRAGVRSMVQSFASDNGTHVSLQSNGGLEMAFGSLSPARAGTAADAAKAFVSGSLGLSVAGSVNKASAGDQLVVSSALENNGTNHIRFSHEVAGIPVRGEEVAVSLNADNSVSCVNGTYHELPANVPATTISDKDAAARAVAHIGATSLRVETTTTRAWLPIDGKLTLAILANVASAAPLGDYEVAIDAATGRVIGGENHLENAAGGFADVKSDEGKVTAEGKIYPHSPLDHEMMTTAITNLNAKDKLVGSYVNVTNAKEDAAVAANGQFFYEEGNTHFAEVMVYRNLEQVHGFYKSMGFTGRDKVMAAAVHYGDAYDNAFYSPMSDSMSFGDGNKLNNLSLEDNVAFHEYSHGVVKLITPLSGAEGGAMNEADADYFACTMTGDSKLGVWVMRKLNRPWMRNLDNKKHYPEDLHGEVHADGEIWGAVMWDIRNALGAGTADRTIFKSWYNMPNRPSMKNGGEAIIAADKQLNNGANADKLTAIFKARGIFPATNAQFAGERSIARQASFLGLFNE